MKKLDFWYEFASTYSYPAAMRIEELAKAAGVAVAWRPFLLGPIFKAQGWNDSPFNLQVLKGRYMWRDLTRICEERGLPKFHIPANFPQHSLGAARVALALDDAARPAFSRAVYLAEFADGLDIGDADVLEAILQKLGYDPRVFLSRASTPEIKDRLRANTDEAQRLGIFGAPTFVLEDGEMYWGNDRLEQAIEWAKRR